MGRSKIDFMNDREAELYSVGKLNVFEQLSDTFLKQVDEYEAGNVDALETAVKMRKDYERLEIQMNMRKMWIDEQKNEIENEAEKYPEGYKGYKVTKQTRETKSFKNIAEWLKLEQAKKDFEAKSIAALNMVRKGGLNVDENGEEIELPEITTTSFIKFEKIKNN